MKKLIAPRLIVENVDFILLVCVCTHVHMLLQVYMHTCVHAYEAGC